MDAFDALPADVRHALAKAAFPFPPIVAQRLLNRGVPAEIVAGTIADADRRVSALRAGA